MRKIIQNINYRGQNIDILRLDISQPIIQGNKYYKLKYNLKQAIQEGKTKLLSFGGEYSNHIDALARLGKAKKIQTIGIIRAEAKEPLSYTLAQAHNCGMQLHYATRTQYRELRKALENQQDETFQQLTNQMAPKLDLENTYIIPEGGTNLLALKGTSEILDHTTKSYQYICCAVGTAGTLAGIIASPESHQAQVLGFAALKGNFFQSQIKNLLQDYTQQELNHWHIIKDYHFGAYAAYTPALIAFINTFSHNYHIALDPIYTGKLFYGIFDLIDKNYFPKNASILAIHTGGIQGIHAFNQKEGKQINLEFDK